MIKMSELSDPFYSTAQWSKFITIYLLCVYPLGAIIGLTCVLTQLNFLQALRSFVLSNVSVFPNGENREEFCMLCKTEKQPLLIQRQNCWC